MCNLYSITTNQAAIIALFRVINRYVGNLAPMPGVFPDYPAPVVRNTRDRPRVDHDAVGHAAATPHRRSARHQHPQHVVAALAKRAQAGEPMLGPGQQFCRVRAGAEPGDQAASPLRHCPPARY
jgi:putative SOS response-associated peptidase YedK